MCSIEKFNFGHFRSTPEEAKKILIFSTAYFPFVGGAEVAVKEITDRIPGIEFSMITARMDFGLPKFERLGKIEVYRVGIGLPIFDKFWLAFFGWRLATRLHKENKYEAIWAVMASFGGLAACLFKKKNPEVKFLLTLQEGDDLVEVERKARLIKKWFRSIFISADYIQAISNYLADWAKRMGAVCPIEVVPNGVDLDGFRMSDVGFRISDVRCRINDFKEKLGVGKDEKVIITVSRLVKKNGVGDLIEAMKDVKAKLLICGEGEERQKLEVRSKKLGIEDKVKFLGFIPPAELPKYYAIADVFCRPSLSEGLGNVFLEAMAAGVPVIATPVGGIPDFLIDNKTGWFCQVKNPASIAEKIKWILDEKDVETHDYVSVQKVVDNARRMIGEKYEWDKIAREMDNIFNKITSAEGGPASGGN